MKPKLVPAIFAAVLGIGALTACDDSTSTTTASPSSQAQPSPSAAGSATSASAATPATPESAPIDGSITPTASTNCDMDLSETDFGPFLASGNLITRGGQAFPFFVDDNHFDACKDLSYAVVRGDKGDGLVLFSGDKLTENYSPELVNSISTVFTTGPNQIEVTWDNGNKNTVVKDGNSVRVSPDMKGKDVISLKNPPQTQNPPIAQGNGKGRPYGDYRASGTYRLNVDGGRNFICTIGGMNQVRARCAADFPTTWKFTDQDHRQAEQVYMTTGPVEVHAEDHRTVPSDSPEAGPTLKPGTKHVVGTTLVDLTTPGVAILRQGETGPAMKLTPDSYSLE